MSFVQSLGLSFLPWRMQGLDFDFPVCCTQQLFSGMPQGPRKGRILGPLLPPQHPTVIVLCVSLEYRLRLYLKK